MSAEKLAQGPLQSPSVFNFFRPGYVPPTTEIAARGLSAPEFQITNETSVAGFVNYMHSTINSSLLESPSIDIRANYAPLLALADNAGALLEEINLVLASGQVPPAVLTQMKTAVDTITVKDLAGRRNRVLAALTLVIASPEYIVQK